MEPLTIYLIGCLVSFISTLGILAVSASCENHPLKDFDVFHVMVITLLSWFFVSAAVISFLIAAAEYLGKKYL